MIVVKWKSNLAQVAMIVILSLFAIFSLIPFWFLLTSSLRPGVEMIRHGITLDPHFESFTLDLFKDLFSSKNNYFIWYGNSLLYTGVQTVLGLVLTSLVGYGLGSYKFKGRNVIFVLVLLVMMIPLEIMMIPLYKQMVAFGFMDNILGVVLPFAVFAPAVFFFRQYSLGLPRELRDAGRVDGLTEYGIFLRIMVPLMKPAYGAMAILISMNSWNAIVWPMVVLRDSLKKTIPIGLSTLLTPYGNNYDLLLAGAVLAVIPIVVLFALFQKSFMEGLTVGSLKG